MHTIEPYYNWRGLYTAETDNRSPFFERVYSEFEFTNKIYNFVIHPQWDDIGCPGLFVKLLFVDHSEGYCIIELLGEWNDAIDNDIMTFKRDFIELLSAEGVNKFIIIGENLLNFHSSDDCYYEEWFDEVEDNGGWIAFLNFREHVMEEFKTENIDYYIVVGGELEDISWRTQTPDHLYNKVSNYVMKRLA